MALTRKLFYRNHFASWMCSYDHRSFCHAVKLDPSKQFPNGQITYNQVRIPMISREFQQLLFDCEITEYSAAPAAILKELAKHGIDIHRPQQPRPPVYFDLPKLLGRNIAEHMEAIADDLTAPYLKLLESFSDSIPGLPTTWSTESGWTMYSDSGAVSVPCPLDDVLVLDTEILMTESQYPVMATALSPKHWYSWVSPYLYSDCAPSEGSMDGLIPLYHSQPLQTPKCVIGHFISFDRSRLLEEYYPQGTGTRFVDTLSLHVAVSGLTSTQRLLKTTATKHLFNNKLWKNQGVEDGLEFEERLSSTSFKWISQTSLNNLTDVYRLYCQKDPPQDKTTRSVFEIGTKKEVQSQFQKLMQYCATDVHMTYEVFRNILPLFRQRFPHLTTLHGLLEMGSMYLPVNRTWSEFQQRSNDAFAANEHRQKRLLMQLADETLERYSKPDADPQNDPWLWDLDWSKPKVAAKSESVSRLAELPKWYRELIPKPVKDNLDAGPALLTAQMRIAPKLLRLCWDGLPLHYDMDLKWGVLIPGRAPQPYGDPRYYEDRSDPNGAHSSTSHPLTSSMTVRSHIPVTKHSKATETELVFPYKAYLSHWTCVMQRRLQSDLGTSDSPESSFTAAYHQRFKPCVQDGHLLDELRRSLDAMPLEYEERARISASIAALQEADQQIPGATKVFKEDQSRPAHMCLGEMQVRGPAFWSDPKRYQVHDKPSKSSTKTRRTQRTRQAVDTVNPVIPTCWFCHLPHESGDGVPVGSPLSRSFQVHIASNRLHSAPLSSHSEQDSLTGESATMGLADRLLLDRVHASFWQSYSKRVKEQIAVWIPSSRLPENIVRDESFDPSNRYGAILPQVIPAGTVSRRAVEPLWLTASNADKNRLGSEIKAMVQAPPGYQFVGADVDSQEMWIASLIGDASVGFQGATPYGWMTLEGNKADGTDLHTKIAEIVGISRRESKILNYARLYGSGLEFTKHLLTKFSNLSREQASLKATHLMRTTKGHRVPVTNGTQTDPNPKTMWQGGTESAVFNQLESIARSDEPRTPVLKASMTRALNPKLVKDNFLPSRINWVVQSSAVDYLHCMMLVMSWLIREYKLPARLCISIHDEVRYMCHKDAVDRVALALQIANLFTRAFFAYQLGMRDLPESVAFFSSVEIDSCLRKNPEDDCVTPSNPEGLLRTYNIKPGESVTIQEILERTAHGKLEST